MVPGEKRQGTLCHLTPAVIRHCVPFVREVVPLNRTTHHAVAAGFVILDFALLT